MKKCPFCGEEIADTAKKCRFCGEWLEESSAPAESKPTVAMPQIVINNDVSQAQSTEVNVAQVAGGSTESKSSGWLYFELFCVAGVVWALTSWWIALLTFFGLAIALFIPGLGHAICVILGAGVGLIGGVIAAALGAPTWAAWIIGIIVGLIIIGINLEARKANVEDADL